MNDNRKELAQFFIIAFLVSWLLWLPGVLTYFGVIAAPAGLLSILELVGGCGPAIAALILIRRQAGGEGVRAMLRSAVNVKAVWRFWVGAVLMLLCLHAASRLVLSLVSTDLPQSEMITSPVAILPLFVVMFLVGGGLGEEIGWRGYALDRLQVRNSALVASLLLAAVWIVWHLPLFYYGGTNQSLIPFWLFVVPVVALAVILTWVYNNTKTVFAAAIFHTVGNMAHEIFRVVPTESSPALTGYLIFTGFYVAAAVVIVLVYGAKNLRRARATQSTAANIAPG
jgi:membrane protease YdiL (CAAX protease family)